MKDHETRIIANLISTEVASRQNRVLAVEWLEHDPLTCDGRHLDVNTEDFLTCPAPGCGWQYDPDFRCPVHGYRGDA